jgi:FixJ family two-component response regulator
MTARPMVFVVDDNPDIRMSPQALFDAAGLKVGTYASARGFLGA